MSTRIDELLHPSQPAWLREGVQQWLEHGGHLHQHLGLHRTDHYRSLRDHYIISAWLTLRDADSTVSPWTTALELRDELEDFRSDQWPGVQGLDDPPARWSAISRHLFYVCRYGDVVGLPATARQLSNLVKSRGCYVSGHIASGVYDDHDSLPSGEYQ